MRFPTLNDVARESGYSANTVSRYINKKGYISKIAEEKIRLAIEKLNYFPSLNARAMKSLNSFTIALIVPSIKNDFYASIVRVAEDYLKEWGYVTMVFESRSDSERERKFLELCISFRVQGIILAGVGLQNDDLISIMVEKNQIKMVMIEIEHKKIRCDHILMSDKEGSYLLTEHLIKVHNKRRIGFIISDLGNNVTIGRYIGYKNALQGNNIDFNEEFLSFGPVSKLNGYNLTKQLIAKKVDAIYTSNTIFGTGCIKALNEMHIRYPEDLAFVSFDDYDINTIFHPYVTSLKRVDKKIGEFSAKLLMDRINDKSKELKKVIIPMELEIRESCGCKLFLQ
jgi:DNA-binding LacI/PurR family transcriptional regulator